MENFVWRNFISFTLFCEENYFGGIEIYSFLGFPSWIHVGLLRRGERCVHLGEFLGCLPCVVRGVNYYLRTIVRDELIDLRTAVRNELIDLRTAVRNELIDLRTAVRDGGGFFCQDPLSKLRAANSQLGA
jgi:hypothetical protein